MIVVLHQFFHRLCIVTASLQSLWWRFRVKKVSRRVIPMVKIKVKISMRETRNFNEKQKWHFKKKSLEKVESLIEK